MTPERLLAIGNSNVLDLRGAAKELRPLALGRIEPIAGFAVVGSGPLQVSDRRALDHGAARRRPDVPQGVHLVVLGQHRGQALALAGDDVDDAARHVGGVEQLVRNRSFTSL